jgi:hypothetical protein
VGWGGGAVSMNIEREKERVSAVLTLVVATILLIRILSARGRSFFNAD